MQTIWTGERVRLRPFKSAEELYGYSLEQHLSDGGIIGPMWFTRIGEDKEFEPDGGVSLTGVALFAVERLDTGELAGLEALVFAGMGNISAEVGTFILPRHRSRGFGIEAKQLAMCFGFENLPLERVGAFTFGNHPRAQRGLERCGMQREGVKKLSHFSNGRFTDRVFYVIFREQWEKLPIRKIVKRG